MLLAVCCLAGVLACGPSDREHVIGFAFPDWGYRNVNVAQDELDVRRDRGGPALRIVYDSATTGDAAADEVRRAQMMLAQQDLVGVVGHGGSRGSLVAAPLYNEAGVVQLVPTGTSSALDEAGPWTFTLAPCVDRLVRLMVDLAADRLGARAVTICYVGDEYGFGLADELERECTGRGLRIVDGLPFSIRSDLAALAALSLAAGVPDAVFVVGRDREVGALVAAFSALAPGLRFVGADGIEFSSVLRQAAGAAVDSLYAVTFWHADRPDSVSRAFVERYRRLNGHEPAAAHAMRHDALMTLARAVEAVGPDRVRIRDWLRGLGTTHPALRGVTGDISFAPDHHRPLVIVRALGGRTVLVRQDGGGDGH